MSVSAFYEYAQNMEILGQEFMRLSDTLFLSRQVLRDMRKLPDDERKAAVEKALNSGMNDAEEARELVRSLVASESAAREDARNSQQQRDAINENAKRDRKAVGLARENAKELRRENQRLRVRLTAAQADANFSTPGAMHASEAWRQMDTAFAILRHHMFAGLDATLYDDGSRDHLLSIARLRERGETVVSMFFQRFDSLMNDALGIRGGGAEQKEEAVRRAAEIEAELAQRKASDVSEPLLDPEEDLDDEEDEPEE